MSGYLYASSRVFLIFLLSALFGAIVLSLLGSQEISRRELRKALERQGVVASLREEEILLLCDSLDPDRRGRVRLTDVRDSLFGRGTGAVGRSSGFEVRSI